MPVPERRSRRLEGPSGSARPKSPREPAAEPAPGPRPALDLWTAPCRGGERSAEGRPAGRRPAVGLPGSPPLTGAECGRRRLSAPAEEGWYRASDVARVLYVRTRAF
ncbi:MAG: hypothetical protein CW345_10275 [Firmicutes bacterium]|nr:hypothetical protein [Bacillota bacterium]MBO2522164.1 hypothetical protein [Bacillota bacterium]